MNPLNTWTLGVLIGLPIAAVILVVSVACVVLGIRAYYRDTTGYGDGASAACAWHLNAAGSGASVPLHRLLALAWQQGYDDVADHRHAGNIYKARS